MIDTIRKTAQSNTPQTLYIYPTSIITRFACASVHQDVKSLINQITRQYQHSSSSEPAAAHEISPHQSKLPPPTSSATKHLRKKKLTGIFCVSDARPLAPRHVRADFLFLHVAPFFLFLPRCRRVTQTRSDSCRGRLRLAMAAGFIIRIHMHMCVHLISGPLVCRCSMFSFSFVSYSLGHLTAWVCVCVRVCTCAAAGLLYGARAALISYAREAEYMSAREYNGETEEVMCFIFR